MEILTSVRRLYIRFKSLVNDFVYSFGRAALLFLVEVYNHTVPVRERRRIRVKNPWGVSCTPPRGVVINQKFYSRCNFHTNIDLILPLDDEHTASMGNTEASIKALESTAMWTNEDVALQKLGERLV